MDGIHLNNKVGIVGGGITGLISAYFLSLEGYEVDLYEKKTLLSETSSKTTKLIHGGIRYLENLQFYEDIPILNDHKDLTHGDDYELCFTAPCNLDDKLKSQGFFLIGKIKQKLGLSVKKGGSEITFEKNGWDPFE